MKLKGAMNNEAKDHLEKNFLPALEKMGKTCQVLISPTQIMFVQSNEQGTDGALVKLELPTDFIFSELAIESRKDNMIAFSLNVSLLIRTFAATRNVESESMEVKLTTRRDNPGSENSEKQPVLNFSCVGLLYTMDHQLPVSRPYTASEVDDLLAMVGSQALMDWYVNVKLHISTMEALLLNLRQISSFVTVLATRAGELHLQVQADHIMQGIELAGLDVYPNHEAENAAPQTADTPDLRFFHALGDDLNAGPHAEVLTRHLTKALAACQLVNSSMILLAVGDASRPMVHLLCVFHQGGEGPEEQMGLHVWLPVREDDV